MTNMVCFSNPPFDVPFRVLEMGSKSFVLTLDRLMQLHLVVDQASGDGLTFSPSYVVGAQVPLTKEDYGLGTMSLCF